MEPLTLKILLMGDPNVGKSVIFSLAGIEVIFANYPGTILEYTEE
jgi:ferrous iron transport protein B